MNSCTKQPTNRSITIRAIGVHARMRACMHVCIHENFWSIACIIHAPSHLKWPLVGSLYCYIDWWIQALFLIDHFRQDFSVRYWPSLEWEVIYDNNQSIKTTVTHHNFQSCVQLDVEHIICSFAKASLHEYNIICMHACGWMDGTMDGWNKVRRWWDEKKRGWAMWHSLRVH